MNGKSVNRYVVLAAVAVFAVSLVVGMPYFGFMLIAAAAGFQAGIPGLFGTGYSYAGHQVTGFPARLLGVTAIASGIGILTCTVWAFCALAAE